VEVSLIIKGRIVAITGAGNGLGAAVAREAAARDARAVVLIDRDTEAAAQVAAETGGLAITADVTTEAALRAAVKQIEAAAGPIDIFVSNAGVGAASDPFSSDDEWDREWRLHVLSNLYAARILLPGMLARGAGHLVSTASSNALSINPVSMAYSVTKHGQFALAEWLAATYGSRGIEITCFCPKGMLTPLLAEAARQSAYGRTALVGATTPQEAAEMMLDAVERSTFLATTYPPVLDEFALRGTDHAAWLEHARSLHDLVPDVGRVPEGDA
jgi:NAD(P)-dependent dehydrogenase (short-subunit alcohol dehydrogenase family)